MVLHSKNTKIVIVGASGFGREALWTIQDCNKIQKKYQIMGFIDDDKSLWGKNIHGIHVLGGLEWFSNANSSGIQCVVAIGEPTIREKIVIELEKQNVLFATIIHPSVIYSDSVQIGTGCIIQAGSIITVDIKIGNHVHINIDSTIGHDTIIEDFVTVNPGVHINGNTLIERGVFIGTGTAMKQKIKIGRGSVIAAGTVVINDLPEFSLCMGVPGKLKTKISPS